MMNFRNECTDVGRRGWKLCLKNGVLFLQPLYTSLLPYTGEGQSIQNKTKTDMRSVKHAATNAA